VAQVLPDTVIKLARPLASRAKMKATALTSAAAGRANPSTAANFGLQWDLRQIGAPAAWSAGKLGDPGVTVAIVDTGIDYDNPDLDGLVDLSRSASFVPSDDSITTATFPGRHPISDLDGHGTNVATIVSSNARAWAGVTSRTTLMGVKVLDYTGSGTAGAILQGIIWAADHGADVANLSLGGSFSRAGSGRYVATIAQVLAYAGNRGTLVVTAAGNDGADMAADPTTYYSYCSSRMVVCVSATGPAHPADNYDAPAFYTNYGRGIVTLAAPGGNLDPNADGSPEAWPWGPEFGSFIWSYCSKTQVYPTFDPTGPAYAPTFCSDGQEFVGYIGTSQAAPHVSGLAALLVAQMGRGKPYQVRAAMQLSATKLGQSVSWTDPYYGAGRINVPAALSSPVAAR
jgi:subtilisin family serine protease